MINIFSENNRSTTISNTNNTNSNTNAANTNTNTNTNTTAANTKTANVINCENENIELLKREAWRVFEIESNAIIDLKERINNNFFKAIDLILNCSGKVIVAGIGKSGLIGRKISSTLSSVGVPALFLHPAESIHGDLGVIAKNDVVIAISYGGESTEFNYMLKYIIHKGISLISITGNIKSTLAKSSNVVINVNVKEEACPLGLAPTASTTATLAMGDALAMILLKVRDLKAEDFALFHPGGSLGRKLLTKVKDVMHKGEALPLVNIDMELKDVLLIMTNKEVQGVVGIIDKNENLVGIVTDGDIRRWLKDTSDLSIKIDNIMSINPKTIDAEELIEKALYIMEKHKILNLFVLNKKYENPQKPIGLVHLHDLLKQK